MEEKIWPFPSLRCQVFREFKNLRRLLQRKCHNKIELCVWLSGLRLFYVNNVAQNRRSVSFACLARMVFLQRHRLKGLLLRARVVVRQFPVVVWQTTSKHAPKSVPHVQHDYFSSFNQSNHSFVALSLPVLSSFLKLLNELNQGRWQQQRQRQWSHWLNDEK